MTSTSGPRRAALGAGRVLLLVLAGALAVAIIAAWHWWLIERLIRAPGWPDTVERAGTWLVVVMAASMPLAMAAQRSMDPRVARWIAWPALWWMGVAWIALASLLTCEVGAWLLGVAGFGVDARQVAVTASSLTALGTAWGMVRAFTPRVNEVEVELANWPTALDGLSVVQLSDVHIGPMLGAGFARRITRRAMALVPDLVVITGDLVDGPVRHVGAMLEPLAELRGRLGQFFVTGNHDFYSGADPWCARVEALGLTVLRNEHRLVSDAGAQFALAGVDDHRGDPFSSAGGEDLEAALAHVPAGLSCVLLAHDPATFRRARRMGVDLQISGHTHGGQIWPFGFVVRATVKWVAGLYAEGRAQIFVSRGTGFWGPPIRLGAPAEISRLVIRRAG